MLETINELKTEKELSAIHEASHACAVWQMGGELKTVKLLPNKQGITSFTHKGNNILKNYDDKYTPQAVLIALAGVAGEAQAQLKAGNYYDFESAEQDCRFMQIIWETKGGKKYPDAFEFYKEQGQPVRDFVRTPCNWLMIVALAKELLVKRELTGAVAIDIMEEAAFMQALSDFSEAKNMDIRDFEQTLRRQGFSKKRSLILISKLKSLFKEKNYASRI